MRHFPVLVFLLTPAVTLAQTPEIDRAVKDRLATLKYVQSLQDPATGGFKVTADGKPSLRACNGAVKAIKYLGGKVPNEEKVKAFVLSCHDPATGAFAEPGGRPDVAITSIGVMAACELGIPKEKFAKAMSYLEKNAKNFEEVRIAAAAVEAWGVKDCPFDLKPWFDVAKTFESYLGPQRPDDLARGLGSLTAFNLRLGRPVNNQARVEETLRAGQRSDGGWGQPGKTGSDVETTYRVMRALYLLKAKPNDTAKLRAFLASHRNMDGGYATKPGDPSTMSGVYYCTIISKWIDELEGKKS
jgi:prenyltransferase beta subunit